MGYKKTYYKVVREHNGRIYSAWVENIAVEYFVNKWTYPNIHGTSLMVYNNLNAAKRFFYSSRKYCQSNMYIYTCHVKNPSKFGIYLQTLLCTVNERELMKILRLKKQHKRYKYLCIYPSSNIIFCKGVKLISKVTCW